MPIQFSPFGVFQMAMTALPMVGVVDAEMGPYLPSTTCYVTNDDDRFVAGATGHSQAAGSAAADSIMTPLRRRMFAVSPEVAAAKRAKPKFILYNRLPESKKDDELYRMIRSFHDGFKYPVCRDFTRLKKWCDSRWNGRREDGWARQALLCFINGEPVAMQVVAYSPGKKISADEGLFVSPSARGWNIASRLVDRTMALLNKRGIREFHVGNTALPAESAKVHKNEGAQALSEHVVRAYGVPKKNVTRTPAGKISWYRVDVRKALCRIESRYRK